MPVLTTKYEILIYIDCTNFILVHGHTCHRYFFGIHTHTNIE